MNGYTIIIYSENFKKRYCLKRAAAVRFPICIERRQHRLEETVGGSDQEESVEER